MEHLHRRRRRHRDVGKDCTGRRAGSHGGLRSRGRRQDGLGRDPTGAVVGLWQAGRHIGATLVNEPGALFWNELHTDSPDTAIAFYEAVLGVTHVSVDAAPGTKYHSFKVAGHDVAGCVEPPMHGILNHWHNYFAVDDADATAHKAVAQGGQIAVDPFYIPWARLLKREVGAAVGRATVLADPQGGLFGVMTTPPQ
jgi:uncharacterized protein